MRGRAAPDLTRCSVAKASAVMQRSRGVLSSFSIVEGITALTLYLLQFGYRLLHVPFLRSATTSWACDASACGGVVTLRECLPVDRSGCG